jgi:hypothetical protein
MAGKFGLGRESGCVDVGTALLPPVHRGELVYDGFESGLNHTEEYEVITAQLYWFSFLTCGRRFCVMASFLMGGERRRREGGG